MVLSAANSDVFEEGGLPREEFKDVYGLMSVRGLRKPGWRAFDRSE